MIRVVGIKISFHGLSTCTGAKARGLSPRTGGQTVQNMELNQFMLNPQKMPKQATERQIRFIAGCTFLSFKKNKTKS